MLRAGATPRRFDEYYRCYPVAMLPGPERENVNHGGKVIMPPSALDKLTRLHITYPMLFELHNGAKERMTHAGVLEFIAEEGKIYLPFWVSAWPRQPRNPRLLDKTYITTLVSYSLCKLYFSNPAIFFKLNPRTFHLVNS